MYTFYLRTSYLHRVTTFWIFLDIINEIHCILLKLQFIYETVYFDYFTQYVNVAFVIKL